MGLFDNMLKEGESLFTNAIVLDYDYQPKIIPYRESEQQHIATLIKPLFQNRNGRNMFIHGTPGIGKTAAVKHILSELEEQTDEILCVYINCWQKNTTFKVLAEVCEQLGYKFTQNKRTEELFKIAKGLINKKSVVIAFDEIDKAEDTDFIYYFLEEIYRRTIILITNHKEWIIELEQRVKSRLMPEVLEFRKYNLSETKGILSQRIEYGIVPQAFDPKGAEVIATKTFEMGDIRSGLYLVKEATLAAEDRASKKIELRDVQIAIKKYDEFMIKKPDDLEEDTQAILGLIKENSGKKIGDLHKIYQEKGGKTTYKTFQRKIKMLEDNRFINVEKTSGGAEGNTSILHYGSDKKEKKLTDF